MLRISSREELNLHFARIRAEVLRELESALSNPMTMMLKSMKWHFVAQFSVALFVFGKYLR
jgi:hypothetical protein